MLSIKMTEYMGPPFFEFNEKNVYVMRSTAERTNASLEFGKNEDQIRFVELEQWLGGLTEVDSYRRIVGRHSPAADSKIDPTNRIRSGGSEFQ